MKNTVKSKQVKLLINILYMHHCSKVWSENFLKKLTLSQLVPTELINSNIKEMYDV